MLSVNLIDKYFQAKHLDGLIEALSANGLELPLPLRIRLSELSVCGLALGLRRVVELTYGPTLLSRRMTQELLDAQRADGSFAGDPLATAAALAAMGRLRAEHLPRMANSELAAAVSLAFERGLAALAAMQSEDGLFHAAPDRTQQDRALTAAFVVSLLVREDAFRQAVRFADLMGWFEQHQDQLEADTERLWRQAQIDAPQAVPLSPAAAAIAA